MSERLKDTSSQMIRQVGNKPPNQTNLFQEKTRTNGKNIIQTVCCKQPSLFLRQDSPTLLTCSCANTIFLCNKRLLQRILERPRLAS